MPGWNQAWRAPLREALDSLRDTLAPLWEEKARRAVPGPWEARDEYVRVVLDRSAENDAAVPRGAGRPRARRRRSGSRRSKLLELQRHAQLMYTSCGWFFDDIGGIEARQVIQYAGRVLQLSGELFGAGLEERFLEPAREGAEPTIPRRGDGRQIYEESVRPAMVSLEKVGAHYGVSSLFFDYGDTARVYCYDVAREDYRLADERPRAAGPRARPRALRDHRASRRTSPSACCTSATTTSPEARSRFRGRSAYEKLAAEIAEPFRRADLTEILRTVDRHFGSGVYTLRLLFRDEQQQVLGRILRSVLGAADTVYRELYEEHAPLMRFLSSHGIAQPRGFRMAAELALNTSLRAGARGRGARPGAARGGPRGGAQRRRHAARGRPGPGGRAHARASGRGAARATRRT